MSSLISKIEERPFIRECIEVYKSLPVLWNTQCKDYSNRLMKNDAYQILVNKFREKYPEYNREDVIKRINSLRTNYRKELKRINDLEIAGVGGVEPRLWYFYYMGFLGETHASFNCSNAVYIKEEVGEDNFYTENITQMNNEIENEDLIMPPVTKKKKKNVQDELIALVCDHLKSSESEFDKIAKAWAVELQKLNSEQQIHAKKAINDILYEGQLGNLQRNCVQINPPSTSCTSSPCSSKSQ